MTATEPSQPPGLELVEKTPQLIGEYLELVERNRIRLARWERWAETEPTRASLTEYLDWAQREVLAGRAVELVARREGRLVGSVGARIAGDVAEVGYWIDTAAEGHGVATASVTELLTRLSAIGIRRAEAVTAAENIRSRALLDRLGFAIGGEPPGPLLLARGPVARVRYTLDLTTRGS